MLISSRKSDIGGISLTVQGAKNFKDVVIVPSKAEYSVLLISLKKKGAERYPKTAKCLQSVHSV